MPSQLLRVLSVTLPQSLSSSRHRYRTYYLLIPNSLCAPALFMYGLGRTLRRVLSKSLLKNQQANLRRRSSLPIVNTIPHQFGNVYLDMAVIDDALAATLCATRSYQTAFDQ